MITGRIAEILLDAEITPGRLNRRMAERNLDLSIAAWPLLASFAKVRRRSCGAIFKSSCFPYPTTMAKTACAVIPLPARRASARYVHAFPSPPSRPIPSGIPVARSIRLRDMLVLRAARRNRVRLPATPGRVFPPGSCCPAGPATVRRRRGRASCRSRREDFGRHKLCLTAKKCIWHSRDITQGMAAGWIAPRKIKWLQQLAAGWVLSVAPSLSQPVTQRFCQFRHRRRRATAI